VAICIWLAARQLPEELSRRTLFPLLARPVHRVDVLAGKLLGVWMLSTVALLVLGGIGWLNLAANRAGVGPIFYQFLFLRALSFGPIAAMTIAISLAASGPATVVTSGLLTFGASIFARTLADATDTAVPWLQPAMRAVYFCVPHLDLFDLSQRVAFNYQPIPFWAIAALTAYGAGYTAVFLGLGSIRFREMAV
jgi:ABC-type transport system involved in multi-copper enzyme maturation permease subunit